MAKILITRRIPGKALERLRQEHEVVESTFDRSLTVDEMIQMGEGAEAVLTLLTDRWTGEMMDKFPNLRIIANYAVGYDNVDISAAAARKIAVTNTPSDEVNQAVAEFAWGLILNLSRRIMEASDFARKGAYKGWEPDVFLGRSLKDKTLGIVGLGRIGGMVAQRAEGFGMRVLYTGRARDREREGELKVEYRELSELLAESDFVTVHVPLTAETKHLINEERIALMREGAFLINTARGGVVDEHALARALKHGRLSGAALDVHENEPQMNPELMQMPNVVLTPHVASATVEVREKMTGQAVDSILALLSGARPENLVNPTVFGK